MKDPNAIALIINSASNNNIVVLSYMAKYLTKIMEYVYQKEMTNESAFFKRGQIPPGLGEIAHVIMESRIDFPELFRIVGKVENRRKLGNKINCFYELEYVLKSKPLFKQLFIKKKKVDKKARASMFGRN